MDLDEFKTMKTSLRLTLTKKITKVTAELAEVQPDFDEMTVCAETLVP